MYATARRLLQRLIPRAVRRAIRRPGPAAPRLSAIAQEVRAARLTYLSPQKLANIESAIADVERRGVSGSVLECGIALGGSAIVLARLMGPAREFHGYDVFGMIPPPGENDDEKSRRRYEVIRSGESAGIGGDPYYGYVERLYDRVVETFGRYGLAVDGRRVSLHEGLFADTLHPEAAVALAHIDCDWYEPVRLCLDRIYPKLAPGGYMVLDDYNDYGGCRRATDEFLRQVGDIEVVTAATNMVLRRRPA
jgi:asparagine synthase (glutamine-hydrolysing)